MSNHDRNIGISAGWIAALGIGLMSMTAPQVFSFGYAANVVLFVLGALLFLATIVHLVGVALHEKGTKVSGPFFAMAAGVLIFLCGLAWQTWPKSTSVTQKSKDRFEAANNIPDVTMGFLNGNRAPAVTFRNNSDRLAQDVNWTILLWNMTDPKSYSGKDNGADAHEPLQIPSSSIKYIRPHGVTGPEDFVEQYAQPFVKTGDVLIGCSSVICSTCKRGYTYLIYLKYQQGGWYALSDDIPEGNLIVPTPMTKSGSLQYMDRILNEAERLNKIPF